MAANMEAQGRLILQVQINGCFWASRHVAFTVYIWILGSLLSCFFLVDASHDWRFGGHSPL